MELDVESIHNGLRHFKASLVDGFHKLGVDSQAGLCFGVVDVVEHEVKRTQGAALPGFADFAEQAVLNGIPFGSPRRIMTNGHA